MIECSELLSEFSSSSIMPGGNKDCHAPSTEATPTRTAVSSTRLLFDTLEQYVCDADKQVGIEALPIFLQSFLQQNR